jgi:hypothetical protein
MATKKKAAKKTAKKTVKKKKKVSLKSGEIQPPKPRLP